MSNTLKIKFNLEIKSTGKTRSIVSKASRVMLVWKEIEISAHPDRHEIFDFVVKKHSYLQDQIWEAQKTDHMTLVDV